MSRRLSDNKNIKHIINKVESFRTRGHGITITRIIYGLLGILALLTLSIQALTGVMQADITKATVDNLAISIMFIAGSLVLLTVFFMGLILKLKRIITITEFQNMVFANAIRNKSDYCIMLTEDNEVIYMDDSAHKLFNADNQPIGKKFSINQLFDESNLEFKSGFLSAIKEKTHFKLPHMIQGSKFMALLEPLKSPKGFLLLRANINNS